MWSFNLSPKVRKVTHHSLMASPAIALAFTALSLLLLVLVLLSVPGPIKGLYWFSVPAEVSGMGKLSAGVLGWCGESISLLIPNSLPYPTSMFNNLGMGANVRTRHFQLHLRPFIRQ